MCIGGENKKIRKTQDAKYVQNDKEKNVERVCDINYYYALQL